MTSRDFGHEDTRDRKKGMSRSGKTTEVAKLTKNRNGRRNYRAIYDVKNTLNTFKIINNNFVFDVV
jgi:hypothetical protein